MIPVPAGSRVWLATGHTDMRKGCDGLATLVQDHLARGLASQKWRALFLKEEGSDGRPEANLYP
ncbi:IS66 family insertion sequence element accessory protein TnpB [uncultured Methylobacterium sp.]|jgi:hypothetical protein|uniref:IS66 family insertion sequence element accessory protein TnpB n=1 Tax=uncultured Methylobacterium sp. TaxID=157278 RepID=UPI002617014E|nr:IS66 family insertion sequence element accessory protein TnpB [uncultured Methylobacterium sp.]